MCASSVYNDSYGKSRIAGMCAGWLAWCASNLATCTSNLETVGKLPFVRGPSLFPKGIPVKHGHSPPPWLQSHLSSSLVASQTYFPSFPRRKKICEIFYTFISRAPSIIGAEFCNRDGLFMYIIGAATTTRQPVPRSGFVWGKKKSKPDY